MIAAARATGRRLLIVFQPHRYTRTRDLMPEFAQALSAADEVVLTDIYPAGEAPIEHVTVDALAAVVRANSTGPLHVVHQLAEIPARVVEIVRKGDLIITLGAGTIGGVGDRILAALDSTGEKTT